MWIGLFCYGVGVPAEPKDNTRNWTGVEPDFHPHLNAEILKNQNWTIWIYIHVYLSMCNLNLCLSICVHLHVWTCIKKSNETTCPASRCKRKSTSYLVERYKGSDYTLHYTPYFALLYCHLRTRLSEQETPFFCSTFFFRSCAWCCAPLPSAAATSGGMFLCRV